MRATTGLLLTAALLIPGAARAQPGFTGPYNPLGPRLGVPVGPRSPYAPGLPPSVNDILNGRDSPGAPFSPRRYGPRGPSLPSVPGVSVPYIPGAPTVGVPFERPLGNQLPPEFADPRPDFKDPTWWNTIHDKTVPQGRNLPQLTAPVINIKDLEPKQNLTPPPAVPPLGGCSNWAWILGALAAGIGAAARGFRRSSDERK